MIDSITLLGSSSGRNAGDAALISGIMDSIDLELGKRVLYEIPTIKPSFIRESYQNNVKPISMLPWHGSVKMLGVPTMRSILRTDLSLIFDAILFDKQLFNPLFNHLSSLALMLPIAKRKGKKLGCYNVGAGPVSTPLGKKMLRDVCEMMDFITVRDQDSYDLIRNIGVTNPRVMITADAALNVTPASTERARALIQSAGLDPAKPIVALNISAYLDTWAHPGSNNKQTIGREQFFDAYAKAVNTFVETEKVQLLFVCTQYHDVEVTQEILRRIHPQTPKGIISNREASHYEIEAVLAQTELLFGMRLHATILCSASHTPIACLPHQPKVQHYFKLLGLDNYVLEFKNFSFDSVLSVLRKTWSDRAQIRKHLEGRIPALKAKSMIASRLVKSIDMGHDFKGSGLPSEFLHSSTEAPYSPQPELLMLASGSR